jgi:hypothetical protein
MSNKSTATVAAMGIDVGKNWFHVVGLDERGAIVLRQKWSRTQVEARLANIPPCLIGTEACVGARPLFQPRLRETCDVPRLLWMAARSPRRLRLVP